MNANSLYAPLGTAAGLAALVLAAVLYADRVPAAAPIDAPGTAFSAQRAILHVQMLARPPLGGPIMRNAAAREYVREQLVFMGLRPELQTTTGIGTRYPSAAQVTNILARLPGTRPGGPAVLLMAHTDAVPVSPGAGDDGAGTAALLETLRALRASRPLVHDVIVLFTDGEEDGMLGAAAFVREHRWAKDVAFVLNFEGRGTNGPSVMFETGPGNLDAARLLRRVPGVTATSLSVTVYRKMPNDTDLSELMALAQPALNFGFIGGVERYHTAQDDIEHLDSRSVQHHGNQALALTRAIANGALPRPKTGDAVYFTLPLIGMVLYPEPVAVVLAVLVLALAGWVIVRGRAAGTSTFRSVTIGAVGTIVAPIAAAICAALACTTVAALHGRVLHSGQPEWSGVYASAVVLLAFAVASAFYALARRFADATGFRAGAILAWALLSLVVSLVLPGVSFLFSWPVLLVSLAVLLSGRWPGRTGGVLTWLATAIVVFLIAPIVYTLAVVALGVNVVGGTMAGFLTSLTACLLVSHVESMGGTQLRRVPAVAAIAALLMFAVGAFTVRTNAQHPGGGDVVLAIDADSNRAWLTGYASSAAARSKVEAVLDSAAVRGGHPRATAVPAWVGRGVKEGSILQVPVVQLPAPTVSVMADSTAGANRVVTLRILPGAGRLATALSADGSAVVSAAVNGKPIDTSRYRSHSRLWTLQFFTPPDNGFTLTLTLRAGAHPVLSVRGIMPIVPPIPELSLPRRPEHIIPVQNGDVTWIMKRFAL